MVKVLIIEDDESLRDVYQEHFQDKGFDVVTAADGEEGIKKMALFMPDVVLLDIVMPKMSGFDVLKGKKDNAVLKDIPVIVITNIYADTRDLVQNWGVSNVLLKVDFTPGQLVDKVRGLIGK